MHFSPVSQRVSVNTQSSKTRNLTTDPRLKRNSGTQLLRIQPLNFKDGAVTFATTPPFTATTFSPRSSDSLKLLLSHCHKLHHRLRLAPPVFARTSHGHKFILPAPVNPLSILFSKKRHPSVLRLVPTTVSRSNRHRARCRGRCRNQLVHAAQSFVQDSLTFVKRRRQTVVLQETIMNCLRRDLCKPLGLFDSFHLGLHHCKLLGKFLLHFLQGRS